MRPREGTRRWVIAVLLGTLGAFGGCSATWVSDLDRVDEIADMAEEYGWIEMSTPLLVRPNDSFRFGLNMSANELFKDAQSQVDAGVATFDQLVQGFSAGVAAQLDPTQLAAYGDKLAQFAADRARIAEQNALVDAAAHDDYLAAVQAARMEQDPTKRLQLMGDALRQYKANQVPPSTAQPVYPTASAVGVTSSTSLAKQPSDALNALSGNKFLGFQGLFGQGSTRPSLTDRDAIVRAAGDSSVQAIFNVLGQPDGNMFNGRTVVMGVAMVSVNPGWRTRKDFVADLGLELSCKMVHADAVERAAAERLVQRLLRKPNQKVLAAKKQEQDARQRVDTLDRELDNKKRELGELLETGQALQDALAELSADSDPSDPVAKIKHRLDASKSKPHVAKKLDQVLGEIRGSSSGTTPEPLTAQAVLKSHLDGSELSRRNLVAEIHQSEDRHNSARQELSTAESAAKRAPDQALAEARQAVASLQVHDKPTLNARIRAVHPSLVAISPMAEMQVLDLESSDRFQNQLALSLSFALRYAGLGGQADAFEQFVHSKQTDTRSRSAFGTMNAYSAGGGLFGFQVGPKFRAIEDPSQAGPAGNTLDRQSFPVLLLFTLDAEIGKGLVMGSLEPIQDPAGMVTFPSAASAEWYVPRLVLVQTPSWIPTNGGIFTWSPWEEPRTWSHRLSEKDRIVLAKKLDNLKLRIEADSSGERETESADRLKITPSSNTTPRGSSATTSSEDLPPSELSFSDLASTRIRLWRTRMLGVRSTQTLPVDAIFPLPQPKVLSVFPATVIYTEPAPPKAPETPPKAPETPPKAPGTPSPKAPSPPAPKAHDAPPPPPPAPLADPNDQEVVFFGDSLDDVEAIETVSGSDIVSVDATPTTKTIGSCKAAIHIHKTGAVIFALHTADGLMAVSPVLTVTAKSDDKSGGSGPKSVSITRTLTAPNKDVTTDKIEFSPGATDSMIKSGTALMKSQTEKDKHDSAACVHSGNTTVNIGK